ncbi:hypothetical protein AAVH_15412 [Aphelenchoides avenae]|nr:hypothetical protein AAVH_15412 [Aphelenchus avenae]
MCSCCLRLHRHQIHLISYGFVAFCLMTMGMIFTVFAIFQKESQIGKVWLAGPTAMVVGLVLVGKSLAYESFNPRTGQIAANPRRIKLVIDWGPAMMSGREGTVDSYLDQMATPPPMSIPNGDAKFPLPPPTFSYPQNGQCGRHNGNSLKSASPRSGGKAFEFGNVEEAALDRIVYGHVDSTSHSNASSSATHDSSSTLLLNGTKLPATPGPWSPIAIPAKCSDSPDAECRCAQMMARSRLSYDYGSMNETVPPYSTRSSLYQGETMIMGDKQFYI